MQKSKRLIVPLDLPDIEQAAELVDKLSDAVEWFKIGSQLFTASGSAVIEMLKEKEKRVFLDLKFHDIPNTVARVSEVVADFGVDMFNVHASGGLEMMRKAVEAVSAKAFESGVPKPRVLGVTVLTSLDEKQLSNELGVERKLSSQVVYLARLAKEAGLDGVVASPMEVKLIRDAIGEDFFIVTPGVRPTWATKDDQKRVMTPKEAIEAGADMIVIGRPIRNASDPYQAAVSVMQEND